MGKTCCARPMPEPTPEQVEATRKALETYAQSVREDQQRPKDEPHVHDWIDARNEVVTSGEVCLGCGGMR